MKIIYYDFFFVQIKKRYYWFNREELLKKEWWLKEVKKAAKYYIANKEVLREYARNKYRRFCEKGKEKKAKIKGIDINSC